jgi:hypothetical protein
VVTSVQASCSATFDFLPLLAGEGSFPKYFDVVFPRSRDNHSKRFFAKWTLYTLCVFASGFSTLIRAKASNDHSQVALWTLKKQRVNKQVFTIVTLMWLFKVDGPVKGRDRCPRANAVHYLAVSFEHRNSTRVHLSTLS